jgi:hypothetical protein
VAGQRQEHLVQPPRHRRQRPAAGAVAPHGRRDQPAVAVADGGGARRLRDDRGGRVELGALGGAHVEGLPAHLGLQRRRGAVLDHPAVVDHGDLGGQPVRLVQVLGGQQHGRPVGDQAAHQIPDAAARAWVQPGGRLVQEQHPRPADQAGGHVQPPAHAARVGAQRAAAGVGEAEALQQLARALAGLAAGELQQPGDQHQVLVAGELLVHRRVLAREPDQRTDPLRLADHVEAAHARHAAVGAQQGGQDADRGGLARAVGPQQPADRPLPDREVDPPQGRRGPEALVEPLDADHGLALDRRHPPQLLVRCTIIVQRTIHV